MASKHRREGDPPRLITVAMMRPGDKSASYRILGDALSRLVDLPWSLEVIGDGPARRDVSRTPLPRYEGACEPDRRSLDRKSVAGRLAAADLSFGRPSTKPLAAALTRGAGERRLPVVGAAGGVEGNRRIREYWTAVPAGDVLAFAAAVRSLVIIDCGGVRRSGAAARRRCSPGPRSAGRCLAGWADVSVSAGCMSA